MDSSDRPYVIVEYGTQKLTFSVTPSLSFGMLKEDCCLAWCVCLYLLFSHLIRFCL
jgi:hypothetical protein